MGILKKFSLSEWLRQFGLSCRRFPVAVVLLVFLTGFVIFLNHDGEVEERWSFFYTFYPSTGALLAVSLQLLTEDFKSHTRAIVTQVVCHLLWLGVSIYLSQFEVFSLPQDIAVMATVVAMVLSVFLLSFYRRGEDVPFWNFSMRLLLAIPVALLIGAFLMLGINLLLQSLDWLFGIAVPAEAFMDVSTVCMILLAPLLFINQIPQGKNKFQRQPIVLPAFIKGVVQYLFIPLLCIYLITLYIYAAKILLAWQLPVGWVSYLVSASMVGIVAVIYLTHPMQYEPGNSVFKTIVKWMPLVMLPLLVLMTVAIGRRLSDYGITVSRLYVLVFNIWCYVVCIGLLLTHNKRIWWIPASFGAVLFLISVGPQSIANVTERVLRNEVINAFKSTGVTQFPLTGKQYDQWLAHNDSTLATNTDSKLDYLWMKYRYEAVSSIIERDANTGMMVIEEGNAVKPYTYFSNSSMIDQVEIPQGYSAMTTVVVDDHSARMDKDKRLVFSIRTVGLEGKELAQYRFETDLHQLAERDHERNPNHRAAPLILKSDEAALMLDEFNLTLDGDSLHYFFGNGVLFTK